MIRRKRSALLLFRLLVPMIAPVLVSACSEPAAAPDPLSLGSAPPPSVTGSTPAFEPGSARSRLDQPVGIGGPASAGSFPPSNGSMSVGTGGN